LWSATKTVKRLILKVNVSKPVTFADAATLFSAERAEYAFGELDQSGREKIETFAAQHHAAISFMPVEGRVYFVRL
jgi:hypothetical protein